MLEPSELHDPTNREIEEEGGPFQREAEVVYDPVAQHDDISYVQAVADAAAHVSGEHYTHLTYTAGYIWDPRSSPRGVSYYPGSLDAREDWAAHQQER